mmetsp:Transcript_31193/g.28377  ORF Transcript_31193/g.28377 Transcript_31193/m.28377 type:complete len:102 (-) Transcript_31193:289-594(-)
MVRLKHKSSGKIINVTNTHLLSKVELMYMNFAEAAYLHKAVCGRFTSKDYVIMCGDFNQTVGSDSMRYLSQRKFSAQDKDGKAEYYTEINKSWKAIEKDVK